MQKRLVLLATGGTIASAQSDRGLAPALTAADILRRCPIDNCVGQDIFHLDSSNIQPEEWRVLAAAVRRALRDADGCIITHGTDTMAYTAAALSFMLLDIDKPVILTGSQLPLDHAITDARVNLLEAAEAARSVSRGVYVCFHHKLIAGTRAVKMRTTSFDAFDSVNAPLCGESDAVGLHVYHPIEHAALAPAAFGDEINPGVFLLKLFPGTSPEAFRHIAAMGCKGLVLEAFGLGGVHNFRRDHAMSLKKLIDEDIPVVLTSQCLYEASSPDIYEVSHTLRDSGVISAADMTTEAAVTKLMWVLGHTHDMDKVRQMMAWDYCGEINADRVM